MTLRVSVVIPSYNAARFLRESIGSVQMQTRPVHELIVVDDGSTDDSVKVARELGAIVLTSGRNAGPAAARNIGWRAATGDVVSFLDADDRWEPEHCETLAELLERFPEVELAYARVSAFGDQEFVTRPVLAEGVPTRATSHMMRTNLVPQIAVMVRRAALEAVGGYDERLRYSEDYHLWLRLSERAPFVCSHAITAHYRVHAAQATNATVKLWQSFWQVRLAFLERARETRHEALGEFEEQLRLGYEDDLRTAWDLNDLGLLRALLALQAQVPGAQGIYRAWRRRMMLFAPVWPAAKALVRTLLRRVRMRRTEARLWRDGDPAPATIAPESPN